MDDMMASSSSFYFTKTGIIIPTITGTVSFLSSALIIFIILRTVSTTTRWSAYHRIIFGLSLVDCFTSLAIALTTIPMPKDVIYPFEMPSYGNVVTCEIQALTIIVGTGLIFSMNAILNIYYLCTLRYNMQESKFRCYVEIPLYITTLALVFGLSSETFIEQKLLNPSPTVPYCMPDSYPVGCSLDDNPECRGGVGRGSFWALYKGTIGAALFILLLSMSLIVHSFCRNERRLLNILRDEIQDEDEKLVDLKHAQEQTGIITRQAVMYIVAFVMSWIFGFLEYLWQEGAVNFSVHTLFMLFQPSQGFFNLIIFLYHKVYVLRSREEDMTLAKAIGIIVFRPKDMAEAKPISNLNAGIDEYFHTASTQIAREYDEIEDPPSVLDGDILSRTDFSGNEDLPSGLSNATRSEYYKGVIVPGISDRFEDDGEISMSKSGQESASQLSALSNVFSYLSSGKSGGAKLGGLSSNVILE